MGDFFGSIYTSLFEDFFGLDLANYLWGQTSQNGTNLYIGVGLWLIGISLAIAIIFYYVINHPRLNNWWGWLIFLGVNAAINFVVGWQWVLKDYYAGLMVKKDAATGKMVDLSIYTDDILAFGVTNMIDAIIAFIVFSYFIKRWSTNCSRAPF